MFFASFVFSSEVGVDVCSFYGKAHDLLLPSSQPRLAMELSKSKYSMILQATFIEFPESAM